MKKNHRRQLGRNEKKITLVIIIRFDFIISSYNHHYHHHPDDDRIGFVNTSLSLIYLSISGVQREEKKQ